jgi:Papain-like cysteine protease AvrRpt2
MPVKNSTPKAVPLTAAPFPPPLDVPLLVQEGYHWCWAACAQMVLQYYGDLLSQQCQLATLLTEFDGCCADPPTCDIPCGTSDVAWLYNALGLDAVPGGLAVAPFATFHQEFAAKRPVQVAVQQFGREGHALIARWAGLQGGAESVLLNDPLGAVTSLLYSEIAAIGVESWTGIEVP